MGWNGSNNSVGRSAPDCHDRTIKQSNNRVIRRGLIAGLISVVLGATVLWFVMGREESLKTTESSDHQTSGKIAIAKHSIVSNALSREVVSSEKPVNERVVDHPPTNQWGNPWHWGPQKLRPAFTSRIDRASQPLYMRVFRNGADRTIAALLTLEPGTPLVGGDEPPMGFEKSFQLSLQNPAIVRSEDSEEVKELKRAVNETKAELKARMDAGEDIVKIVTETRRELRELGAYRENLRKQVDAFRTTDKATPADLHDMVDAANQMLKERGLKELNMPEFYYKNLETRIKLRKARKANEQ